MHTVEPVDQELLAELSETSRHIFTVEEHNTLGGLGSAVLECLAPMRHRPPVHVLGIPDEYTHGAFHEALMEKYGLTAEGLVQKIHDLSKA